MPPLGVTDRQAFNGGFVRSEAQMTWDLGSHYYYRIDVANQTTRVAFLGPESEDYGKPGWVRAAHETGFSADQKERAEAEASRALRAAIAEQKLHGEAAQPVTQKQRNALLRAQYEQRNGVGSAAAFLDKRGFALKEQNSILANALTNLATVGDATTPR